MQFRQTWTLAALLLTVGLLTRRVAALDGTEKGFWDNHAVVVAAVAALLVPQRRRKRVA